MKCANRKGAAEIGGEERALLARPQDPDFRQGLAVGHQPDARERVLGRDGVLEIADQIGDLVREMLDAERPRPVLQGDRGQLVAARRAADAEVDAAGIERLQHAELLGHLERAVMAQHDPARADADMPGLGRHQRHHDLGRAAGEPGRSVVLGQPVAAIAEPIGMAGQLDGFKERVARGHPAAPATGRARSRSTWRQISGLARALRRFPHPPTGRPP